MDEEPPEHCPGCGRTGTLQKRYTTGGGWRVAGYRCRVCGRQVPRTGGRNRDSNRGQ